jgi:NADPH-dependent 2,4-dienoyl-CoA reductase/sulfur reductase-like enzyme/rhodanese-related sulfurtransferase
MKTLIIGGVAGGASCAARLRRLDENAEIVMLERGPHVSFANCGLPYHVGGVIPEMKSLLVADAQLFRTRFAVDARTRHEATAIDRARRVVQVRALETGETYEESYDELVLATGAAPIRPPLPGIDLPGIFTVRSVPDSVAMRQWIDDRQARRAVVVGGGFIGLEMAENLRHRGLEVTVLERLEQVMPPFDAEMARLVERALIENGVKLVLGDGVAGFEPAGRGLRVLASSGASHEADLVVLAIGVRPETRLAVEAGLEIGERGGIRVDARMRTSDPHIRAVGDAVEVRDFVTGEWTLIPLAGPANRQGRIAADGIAGRASEFRGVQGAAICGVFGTAVASVGASEKVLQRAGISDFEKIYLHPGSHAGYYPGAERMTLKLIFSRAEGRVLGAQAVGGAGVDKRIDVISAIIQKGGTVYDLEEAELCYAPQYGSAKDPVNFAGMIAADVLRGDMPIFHWNQLESADVLLDVREPEEFAAGHLPHAVNVPLGQLRERLDELPRGAEIGVYCGVGQRGYYASRLLAQRGYRPKNLSGGYQLARQLTGV